MLGAVCLIWLEALHYTVGLYSSSYFGSASSVVRRSNKTAQRRYVNDCGEFHRSAGTYKIFLQAAKQAGLYPVTLIYEPKAAALYTMHSLYFAMKEGDAFVVCDAGGGTVDLISYEVARLTPNLQLKEVVPGKDIPKREPCSIDRR